MKANLSGADIHEAPSKEAFRQAVANLGTGVAIITSDGPAGLAGCTVSAVTSVSDQPLTLLVCLNRTSRNNRVMRDNGSLCVNLLGHRNQPLAARFADGSLTIDQRFEEGSWSYPADGSPALDNALASLQCAVTDMSEVGSHTVFFLTVHSIGFGEPGEGLAYFQRRFHGLPLANAS